MTSQMRSAVSCCRWPRVRCEFLRLWPKKKKNNIKKKKKQKGAHPSIPSVLEDGQFLALEVLDHGGLDRDVVGADEGLSQQLEVLSTC